MKIKNYLMRFTAAVLIVSSFVMCTKQINKIDGQLRPKKAETAVSVANTENIVDCTYTVQPSQWFVDGGDLPPGSVICIPAGTRGALLLKNLKGTADKPIIVVNKGGKVTISAAATASYGLKTQNCQYFKIMGNGVSSIRYGLDITGGNIGMTLDDMSSDVEVAKVEVRNSGFAGIMVKTDPKCDIATQRGQFTMKNINLHHNYVHKTGGEGFYVGNSFYAKGVTLGCGTVLPHDVVNVRVYKNIIDSTGCEGIQVGSATGGSVIYNNVITSPGLSPFASGQNNGIQIGEGTGGRCYNNLIKDAPGNGIIVLGLGDNVVYNNYIINSGANGIFADSRFTPGPNFQFINNTIINPAMDGIKLNSQTIPMNMVINNVIIIPGAGKAINRMNSNVKLTALNNYTGKDVEACQFVNYSEDDFHLLPSSPLINAGVNALLYGVNVDYYGAARSLSEAFDIGATEYSE